MALGAVLVTDYAANGYQAWVLDSGNRTRMVDRRDFVVRDPCMMLFGRPNDYY